MNYINTKAACNRLGVHPNTLRNWDREGKIKTIRTPGGNRLYDLSSISQNRTKIIYARVNSLFLLNRLNLLKKYLIQKLTGRRSAAQAFTLATLRNLALKKIYSHIHLLFMCLIMNTPIGCMTGRKIMRLDSNTAYSQNLLSQNG